MKRFLTPKGHKVLGGVVVAIVTVVIFAGWGRVITEQEKLEIEQQTEQVLELYTDDAGRKY